MPEIVLSLPEFRRRAIPVAGVEKGSVVPYDIHLRANNEAILNGILYIVKTDEETQTVTLSVKE